MFTIQIHSIKNMQRLSLSPFFLTVAMFSLVGVSVAQQQTQKQLDWPKTFSGQPDFVFVKDEVVKEALQKAQSDGTEPPEIITLDDLLDIKRNLTPLDLEKQTVATQKSSEDLEKSIIKFDKKIPITNNPTLPDVLKDALLDVSEFKTVLENAANMAVKKAYVDLKNYQFDRDLSRLTLQALVTSPEKYAVINNRRYHEKDLLHVMVPVPLLLSDIEQAVNVHMPQAGAIPASRLKQYAAARDDVLKTVAEQIKSGALQKKQRIAVKVFRIEFRKVVFKVGGKTYDLEIKYQL